MKLSISLDKVGLAALAGGRITRAIAAALRKAGMTALRDMRSEASKRIRKRKALKAGLIHKAITLKAPRSSELITGEWTFRVSGKPVPLSAYPHRLVAGDEEKTSRHIASGFMRIGESRVGTVKKRVQVEVNKGKRTILPHAFLATMPKTGHKGIFQRRGKSRLPIDELFGSRPVDALLHAGEADAVAARGGKSFSDTFERLLPLELAKGRTK